MAKYTELFSEFLASGNTLPAAFNQLVGFGDLFSQFYADYEIGFETEELFALKLNAYANIYIPQYADRINKITSLMTGLMNPEKVRETVRELGENVTLQWMLPYNPPAQQTFDAINPSARTKADETTNTDTLTETGYTPDEILRIYDALKIVEYNITRALLNEFRPLFMVVYGGVWL